MNKRAFSFVEIIISISILVVLAIVATTATNNIKNNSNNSRVIADLATVQNWFLSLKNENKFLPEPEWNKNYYSQSGSYEHKWGQTYWVYWKITQNTLDKKYLNITPLDPRTNQYYSYWVTTDYKQFEVAWVIYDDWWHRARVLWNYTWENGIYNLIGAYNSNDFVIDNWPYLPYNPEERLLTARDENGNVYYEWDEIINNSWDDLEIYFSDWSTSVISDNTNLVLTQMDFPEENNLVTKVKIFLDAGSIWTNATSLNNESNFDIFTNDTTASVRWTVFGVNKKAKDPTEVIVKKWIVSVKVIPPFLIRKENVIKKPDVVSTEIDRIKEDISLVWIEISSISWPIDNPKKWKKWDLSSQAISIGSIQEPKFKDKVSLSSISEIKITEKKLDIAKILQKEENNNKWCYLEWYYIKDWESRLAYKEKFVNTWNSCTPAITRECNNWILAGDDSYKYHNECVVKTPWQCLPYNNDWFVWTKALSPWENESITKEELIKVNWVEVGKKSVTRVVECDNWTDYLTIDTNNDVKTINCTAPNFVEDYARNTCVCKNDYEEYGWKCYKNPFGNDYSLIKVIKNISDVSNTWYYWLKSQNVWENLWDEFWLIFDTTWVSQNNSNLVYLYDYRWPNNIILSESKKIKLSNYIGNIVKTSNDDYSNWPLTIELEFDWDDLEEKSEIIEDYEFGRDLDANFLKLKNVKNIRIYNKYTSWASSGWASWTSSSWTPWTSGGWWWANPISWNAAQMQN